MLTPLEPWIAAKIGLADGTPLSSDALQSYQLARVKGTVEYARERSPFYRTALSGVALNALRTLDEVAKLPFTAADDIRNDPLRFLCVPLGEIERVVTLRTSGTTTEAKRLFFTAEDLDLTSDFFQHGMSTFVAPGQRVLIFMPGELPGSVGALLRIGLARMNVEGIVHGVINDARAAIADIITHEADAIVALPVQALGLVRHPDAKLVSAGRLKSVLLTADYVPRAIADEVEHTWGVSVFNHYGMTEMGLGGAVDCQAHAGCHVREADLYFEIVDPETGVSLPEGEEGEIVFTTLTRTGMPLIRYRTGDLARFVPGTCPCGSVVRRLSWVRGRREGVARLSGGGTLSLADLDEALLALPGIVDYGAELTRQDGRDTLHISLVTADIEAAGSGRSRERVSQVRAVLGALPMLALAVQQGKLGLAVDVAQSGGKPSDGSIKRVLHDRREPHAHDAYCSGSS